MKILFIFTGGTIGSTEHGGVISADISKSRKIIEAYRNKHGIDFDYDTEEPYVGLSENNTGEHIRRLTLCVIDAQKRSYDGIIVTHGSDTLQYSSAAIGYALGNSCASPVCIVAANKPIEDNTSNALPNLYAAITLIKESKNDTHIKGVFVPYRNESDAHTKIHRATRLIPSNPFSDHVDSIYGIPYANVERDGKFIKDNRYKECDDVISPILCESIQKNSDRILWLSPYPTMVYPKLSNTTEYVILSSYHSGTVNTQSDEAKEFFDSAEKKGIRVFITGISDSAEYESATLFKSLGILPLKNISPIAAYVKLFMAHCSHKVDEKYLNSSLGGDIALQ